MESTQHKISIAKEKDVKGHNELILKIVEATGCQVIICIKLFKV